MRRLYFRIYLAVVMSLALSALLAGIGWVLFARGESWLPRAEFFAEAAGKLLPPITASPADQQAALLHWSRASGYDLALIDQGGLTIADTSDGALRGRDSWSRWRGSRDHDAVLSPGAFSIALADNRVLVGARPSLDRNPLRRFGALGALLAIALAVGIAAYPMVRRLTRNLEDLERGVAAFGEGNLSARVAVKGRDEVARLAATYNRSAERIETLVSAHKTLLANASHELRTPLSRLRMGIEQCGPSVSEATRHELARNIAELDQLIDEILLASRLEALPHSSLNLEPVDLVALAAEECARAGAELTPPTGPLPMLRADPTLLRRLIRNLLDNTAKYGGAGPADVSIRQSLADTIELDVLDRGDGVPEAEREKIFEPFYRVASARPVATGAGLGLALSRTIATKHGGTLICLPRPGGGTIFRLTLHAPTRNLASKT